MVLVDIYSNSFHVIVFKVRKNYDKYSLIWIVPDPYYTRKYTY